MESIGISLDIEDEPGRPLKSIGGTCPSCGAETDDVDDFRETLDRIKRNIGRIREHFR